MTRTVTTFLWRRSTGRQGRWHLFNPATGRPYCGRNPQGAWRETTTEPYPWPDGSCYSCMDVRVGNFPPRAGEWWNE